MGCGGGGGGGGGAGLGDGEGTGCVAFLWFVAFVLAVLVCLSPLGVISRLCFVSFALYVQLLYILFSKKQT